MVASALIDVSRATIYKAKAYHHRMHIMWPKPSSIDCFSLVALKTANVMRLDYVLTSNKLVRLSRRIPSFCAIKSVATTAYEEMNCLACHLNQQTFFSIYERHSVSLPGVNLFVTTTIISSPKIGS